MDAKLRKLRRPVRRFLDRHAGLVTVLGRHLLTLLTLVAVLFGIGIGFALRSRSNGAWSSQDASYIAFPGEIYLRILNCLIMPLVSSSLLSSLGSLEIGLSGRLALHTFIYFIITTPCAIILGIVLVTAIHPGKIDLYTSTHSQVDIPTAPTTLDTVLDLIRNLFPDNIVTAFFSQYVTERVSSGNNDNRTSSEITTTVAEYYLKLDDVVHINETTESRANVTGIDDQHGYGEARESHRRGTNVLGLVMFCILLGVSVGRLKEAGRPVALFFTALFESIMGLIRIIIWLSPIGILFLVCSEILQMRDFRAAVDQVGLYCFTVIVALVLHGFLVIPIVYFVATRNSPYRFLWNQAEALATAFASASSAAAMPVSIRCLEDNNGVHPKVARFVLPMGIINMQGTALYEAVSVLFIAQVHGIQLNMGNVLVVSVTAAAASMGAAGIPQAGLVTMILVLNSVGLSAKDVSLIIVVDWLLDRFRTLVNVVCDSVAAGIVDHMSKADLLCWESLASCRNNTPPPSPTPPPPPPFPSNPSNPRRSDVSSDVHMDVLALV